jgi:hypothetical protein
MSPGILSGFASASAVALVCRVVWDGGFMKPDIARAAAHVGAVSDVTSGFGVQLVDRAPAYTSEAGASDPRGSASLGRPELRRRALTRGRP